MTEQYLPQGQPETSPAPPPPPAQAFPQAQPYPPAPAAILPEHPNATKVLVLGLLGLLLFLPLAPFAWSIGAKARNEIRLNPGRYASTGGLTAGYIMGIIGTVVLILALVSLIVVLFFLGGLIATAPR